jgi:drug/metabolite transporter (DMT)-like permease
MQSWIIYGLAAAVMIASRDLFTKNYTKKYTASEHILYYYVLCGIIIAGYSCYRKFHMKENIRMIEKEDLWKYILVAAATVIIITPCEVLSIQKSKSPGSARALTNLNTLILFIVSIYFLKTEKITGKKMVGILMTIGGIFLLF